MTSFHLNNNHEACHLLLRRRADDHLDSLCGRRTGGRYTENGSTVWENVQPDSQMSQSNAADDLLIEPSEGNRTVGRSELCPRLSSKSDGAVCKKVEPISLTPGTADPAYTDGQSVGGCSVSVASSASDMSVEALRVAVPADKEVKSNNFGRPSVIQGSPPLPSGQQSRIQTIFRRS